MNRDCVDCFLKQGEKLKNRYNIPDNKVNEIINRVNGFIQRHNGNHLVAPEVSCLMHRMIRKTTGLDDLFKKEKDYYNDLLLSLEKDIRNEINNSGNPFRTALLYALAGNIIDFGPQSSFDVHNALSQAASKEPAIDHSLLLKEELKKASTVLYLGDNTGEIVLDKLFFEIIDHPNLYFATRGSDIINDITYKDAEKVGVTKIAKVISNGYDAPSTLIDRCSPEFRKIFNEADIIISKGQGNLEGLIDNRDKKIFFLLMIKCSVIAELVGVEEKSVVVAYNKEFFKEWNTDNPVKTGLSVFH